MNINELADALDTIGDKYLVILGDIEFKKAADFIRQQEKEITEAGHMIGVLREYISDLENGLDSSIKLNKAQALRKAQE